MSWHSIKVKALFWQIRLEISWNGELVRMACCHYGCDGQAPPRMEMGGFSRAEIKRHIQTFLNLIADEEMSPLRSPFLCQSSLSPLSSEKF